MNPDKSFEPLALQYRKLKKILIKYVNKWTKILNLELWQGDISFIPLVDPDGPNSAAKIGPMWEYKRFTLHFYLPTILKDYSDDEIEGIIVHELSHLLVSGMSTITGTEKADVIMEERTVVELTDILLKLAGEENSR